MERISSEMEWILPRSSVNKSVATIQAGSADLQSVAMGAAASFLFVLLAGALWIVGVASKSEPDDSATTSVSVEAGDR